MKLEVRIRQLIEASKVVYPNQRNLQRLVVCQALLESGYLSRPEGSLLAREHNNLFGIKARAGEPSVSLKTWEVVKGRKTEITAKFAKYDNYAEAFEGHKRVLMLQRYEPVRTSKSLDDTFIQIQKCGYASDPAYSKKLAQIYNDYVKQIYGDLE